LADLPSSILVAARRSRLLPISQQSQVESAAGLSRATKQANPTSYIEDLR